MDVYILYVVQIKVHKNIFAILVICHIYDIDKTEIRRFRYIEHT